MEFEQFVSKVRKKILWCRERVKGEYNEAENIAFINKIESNFHNIINSNPCKDANEALCLVKSIYSELLDYDSRVIEPNLRRFNPLLSIWTSDYDHVIDIAKKSGAYANPVLSRAIDEMEGILDVTNPDNPSYNSLSTSEITLLVDRVRELYDFVSMDINNR